MQILFINNHGGGFADKIEIPDGMTVQELFRQKLPDSQPQDYLIRVNRQPTTSEYVLQPEDRVSITPTKIEGAGSFPIQEDRTKGIAWEPAKGSTVCILPGS